MLDSRMQVSVGDTKASCGNDILATLGGSSKPAMLELNTPSLGSSLQNQILGSLHPESAGITACYLDGSTNTQQRFDFPGSMYVDADRPGMQQEGGLLTFEQQEILQEVCSDSTARLAYGNTTNDASWRGRRTRERNFLMVERPHTAGDEWQSRVSSGFEVDSGPGRMAEDVVIEEQWGEKNFMADRNAALAGDSWGQKRVKNHQRFRYGSPSHGEEGSSRASVWKSLLQIPVSMGDDYGGFGLVQESKEEDDGQYALQGSAQLSDLHSGSNFLGNRHAQRQREGRTPPANVPAEHIIQGPKREREVNPSQMATGIDFEASEGAADRTMMTGARQNEAQTHLSSSRNFHSVFPGEESWQEAGCVSDYLLLTSAIHKAQLLDLQIQENQQHMKQESGGKRSHEKYIFTQGGNFSDHCEKSILSGLPAGLIDSRPDDGSPGHSSLGDLLHGQDYLSDDMVLDARHGENLSAREAYEKARHDQHDDLSGKRVFKRSSKGGPRRPNIIKGQWTPEEDRYTSYTQINFIFSDQPRLT